MRNNLSKNWKSIIFYILIPLLLIGSIFLFSSQSRSVDKNYSEIVALFRDNKVSEFELNLNTHGIFIVKIGDYTLRVAL